MSVLSSSPQQREEIDGEIPEVAEDQITVGFEHFVA